MGKKLLSLGAIAMDIVINSHDLPKDDGFALINQEQMLFGINQGGIYEKI